MFSVKLLMVFSLLTGIFAEQCTIADFGVEDVSDKVTVTNASTVAWATVALRFNHGHVAMEVAPGESRTAIALAATKYTATVTGTDDPQNVGYRDRLLDLRDELLEILSSGANLDRLTNAATELTLVQSALEQLSEDSEGQSCGGTLKTGEVSHVTVNQSDASGMTVWVLDCS